MSSAENFADGMCRGVVMGVIEVSPKVCPSEGVTLAQAVRIVLKFLQDHPERLHLRGSELAEDALSKAFPCSR